MNRLLYAIESEWVVFEFESRPRGLGSNHHCVTFPLIDKYIEHCDIVVTVYYGEQRK